MIGADGFIGKHLLEIMKDAIAIKRGDFELTDKDCWKRLFDEYSISNLYVLAGISHPQVVEKSSKVSKQINVESIANLVQILPQDTRVIYPSSVHVYGKPIYLPIDEGHPIKPTTEYGIQKMMAEDILLKSGKNVVIGRLFNCISMKNPSKYSFLWDWKNQKPPIKVGNIDVIRDLMPVQQAALGLQYIAKHGKRGEIYNVCTGRGVQLIEILKNIGIAYSIDKNRYRKNDVPKLIGCNQKLQNLGFKARGLEI